VQAIPLPMGDFFKKMLLEKKHQKYRRLPIGEKNTPWLQNILSALRA